MKDIDYFYERKLDKTNIKDFYETLPSDLRQIFEESINTNIVWANVLQGYRGPSSLCNGGSGDSGALEPSNGIQEIKFWWGARKDLNSLIPVLGTAVFFAGRTIQSFQGELQWSSLYFDSKTGECLSNNKNKAAEALNNKGLQLFQEGNYTEAADYHSNAYQVCSSGYKNEPSFTRNKNLANAEIKARNLNRQGNNLFSQRNYSEALGKYQEAFNASQTRREKDVYADNTCRAQAEIDAINLNHQGENLFLQGKYSEAQSAYQEAFKKSRVAKEKDIYAINKDKATTVSKVLTLDTLWNKAWEAENDIKTDRSEEAKDIFERVLNESRDCLRLFPDNFRFKHYESLASLKTEGNDLFNQGLESQQSGIELLEEARELNEQRKFQLAHQKFKEAKRKLSEAKEKFRTGSAKDQRFLPCVEFIEQQLVEIVQSIEILESQTLNQRLDDLNINISYNNLVVDDSNITVTQELYNYHKQI